MCVFDITTYEQPGSGDMRLACNNNNELKTKLVVATGCSKYYIISSTSSNTRCT